MQLHLQSDNNRYQIQAYTDDSVTINAVCYNHSLVVLPDQLILWSGVNFELLSSAHFTELSTLTPDVVLLSTGSRLRWPEPSLLVPLIQAGIGFEIMTLSATCRTYTLLAAEDRRVAAVFLL